MSNTRDPRIIAKEIRRNMNAIDSAMYHREKYLNEKNANNREYYRANCRNYSVQCIQVPSTTKSLDKEEFLLKLEKACYQLFSLILQDVTGDRFIFEDEYYFMKDKIEKIENGANITFFQFRNIKIDKDEFFKIFNTHKVFTMENYNNFAEFLKTNYPDISLSQSELDKIVDFYHVQIDRIHAYSTQVGKFPINDYSAFNKLNQNIDRIEDLAVFQNSTID